MYTSRAKAESLWFSSCPLKGYGFPIRIPFVRGRQKEGWVCVPFDVRSEWALVLGCAMDSMAIIVIVVTEIALITPPVGMNVFVLKAVLPDVPVIRIFKGLVPFVAIDVIRLALLVAFPAITLWLGSTIG